MNIQELRQNGFKVKINHHRIFNGIGVAEYLPKRYIDNVLTRGEYEQARIEQRLDFDDFGMNLYTEQFAEDVTYGKAVSPVGGFTTVEVTTPNNEVIVKKYNFGKTVPFCRKKGVIAALGRVMKELREEEFFENVRQQILDSALEESIEQ